MESNLKPGVYQHDKGQDFFVFGVFVHSEKGDNYVAFIPLVKPYAPRVQPVDEFHLRPDAAEWHDSRNPAETVIPGIYDHFKDGHQYHVHGEFVHVETGDLYVAYRALYAPYASLIRPKKMFFEHVDRPEHDNYNGPRFKLAHAF